MLGGPEPQEADIRTASILRLCRAFAHCRDFTSNKHTGSEAKAGAFARCPGIARAGESRRI